MAEVTLAIGGRSYTVACRDGGEEHLRNIAKRVDAKVAEAQGAVGTASEVRQLLFAALLLADEVVEGHVAAPAPSAPTASPAADPDILRALSTLATRVESMADALESAHGAS